MRHRKSFNHLSRKSAHRKAMLANMAASLIIHKRINTTVAKAKALRTYIEPLITKSKEDNTHSRRVVFSYLQSKEAVTELFRDISVKVADRPGGYTRIIKTGARLGDNAEMCMMELVDYNENLLGTKDDKAKSSRRRRRGGSGAKAESTPAAETKTEAKEAPVDETVAEEVAEAAEEKVEEVKAEVEEKAEVPAEEPKAEDVKVETEAEVKEEPVSEEKKEEVKAEAPAEEPKKEDDSEEEKKEEGEKK